jgi:hypothetical protein
LPSESKVAVWPDLATDMGPAVGTHVLTKPALTGAIGAAVALAAVTVTSGTAISQEDATTAARQ